ncbi:MAG TPA: glycosyltransferase family 9 protein [Roseiflexaceae bacterium]|nr:glycosyltransferase family 9 protein [Roseiflexaceae bacterium]
MLFLKPDHLGDVLLATPALAALRQAFPSAQITALVGPWSEFVLQNNPDVDRLLVCPFPGFERAAKEENRGSRIEDRRSRSLILARLSSIVYRLSSLLRPYLTLLRHAMLLRAGSYDLAIVARDDHWWGAALALLAGIPRRVGFAVPECRPFLTTTLPWDPRAHVTRQALELVAAAATDPAQTLPALQEPPARFEPSQADLDWADEWIDARELDAGQRLVVLHPGTAGPDKLWFPERWAAVADAIVQDGARLVLTGGPSEVALVDDIAGRMAVHPPTLAGQTSVGQLAALLRRADLVMGVDSGPLHLAAAQGAPTLHLYGPGDAGRFGPWGAPERHIVVREPLWCSPCGVFDACPRGLERPECMEAIRVERVVSVARGMLADGARSANR